MADSIANNDIEILRTNRLDITISHATDNVMLFEARTKDSGKYVGHVSLTITKKCFGRVGELSYELNESFRGQCYATEILRSAIAYIYAELGLVSLYGVAPEKNLAAQYVLQRIGFALNEELEGAIRYEAWNPKFQTAHQT